MAGRGRPKGPRPKGWSPSFVLRWLEENPAANIMPDLLERLQAEMKIEGRHCSAQTLYVEIARWKKKDPEFREAYKKLYEGRHPAAGNPGQPPLEAREGTDDWKMACVECYVRTKSRLQAAAHAGLSYSHLSNKLSKRHPDYDEDLDHLWRQAKEMMLAGKEDLIEWALEEAKAQGDAKTVLHGAVAVLERLNKEKWSKREERTVSGEVVHRHVVEDRRNRAMEEAARTSRALFGPPAGALPEHQEGEEVVEAEFVEVSEEKSRAATG